MLFFNKKCAKMSDFLCENRKNSLAAGVYALTSPWSTATGGETPGCGPLLCQMLGAALMGPPPNLGPMALHFNPALYLSLSSVRSSDQSYLLNSDFCCTKFHSRCFSYYAPALWNNLPNDVRKITVLSTFKSALKTHFSVQ